MPLDTHQYDQLAEACWDTVLQQERRNEIRHRAGSIRYHLHGKQKEEWPDEDDSDLDD
jgi:hypothetical protein